MSDQMHSIDEIKRRARQAVEQGLPMRVCPYERGSEADQHWKIAYWEREIELHRQERKAA